MQHSFSDFLRHGGNGNYVLARRDGLIVGLCCTNRVMAEVPPSPDGLIPQLP